MQNNKAIGTQITNQKDEAEDASKPTGKHLLKQIYLFPSDLFVSSQAYQVTTVLGTCVSVTLFDVEKKIGGINHFMLPLLPENENPSAKFGDISINLLLKRLLNLGCKRENMQAKVIGGADRLSIVKHQYKIGERNVEIALRMLENEKIPVVGKNTGGTVGRKILFYTKTGEVYMKALRNIELIDFETKNAQLPNYLPLT